MSKMENGDDFNMTGYLAKKKWRCVDFQLRVLEDQLENLGSQMNCVAKASLCITIFEQERKIQFELKVNEPIMAGWPKHNTNNTIIIIPTITIKIAKDFNNDIHALQSRAELAQIKQEEVEGIDREDNTDQVSNIFLKC